MGVTANAKAARPGVSRNGGLFHLAPLSPAFDRSIASANLALYSSADAQGHCVLLSSWAQRRLLTPLPPPPDRGLGNPEPLQRRSDDFEKARRIAGVARGWFHAWYLFSPEPVEFEHQQLA